MSLLAKSRKEGQIQHITPQSAGWRYIGFDVWMLKKGQTVTLESGDRELCLVLVAGLASVKTQHADFPNLGKRMSPFERTPPWSVYIPPQDKVEVTADSDLELAVCSAPGKGSFPARLIRPEDVGVEHRGKGRNQRRVHNILPDSAEADCLLVVEVYTDDRSLDACMAPYNHDVVMVPRGYHPVAAIAGYDSYYLNVMAGPDRKWLFTWEDDHAWINTPEYPRHD
ncbi:5-deoxy-glucuronate isomerase [Klebsiella pneumoniae]|nr:5-deoxy-glucuronate isomerase [Klebsiella pneumoniae]EMB5634006.1 5-deoxy-glucuronate isomerase [Klebsiella pneumoniae]